MKETTCISPTFAWGKSPYCPLLSSGGGGGSGWVMPTIDHSIMTGAELYTPYFLQKPPISPPHSSFEIQFISDVIIST